MNMKLDISIDLAWPSYEDDINEAVRDEILQEVRKAVKRSAVEIRAEVERQISARQRELVKRAIGAIK